ncbi:MAG: RluA family pseudouridine synthase [Planctomycetales bacterium]|nr:RluA family pseudouridine synthase [Planctomycetales bacterium]
MSQLDHANDDPGQPRLLVVDEESAGARLDVYLASQFPQHSRARLRRAITDGGVSVEGRGAKPSERLKQGQTVTVTLPPDPRPGPAPEPIPLDLLYEDEHLIAVNKPPGMVVHPAKGHWEGTLASALAHHFQQLSSVGGPTRPGIVHRLDRDTSGVLVVAKTDEAHHALAEQFQERTTEKHYTVIVLGVPDRDRDWINEPIGPHPYQRERMAIRRDHPDARDARTFYEVRERFNRFSLLDVQILTGRTHQIRVHLTHAGYPVLCDRLYGGRAEIDAAELRAGSRRGDAGTTLEGELLTWRLTRQALHAERLKLRHPVTGDELQFTAPLPADMAIALKLLRS